jgi:hypothetical protein
MRTQQQLKMSIMGRIYVAYTLRRVFRSSTLRALLSVGSLLWIFSAISIAHVVKNMFAVATSGGLYDFAVTALSKTDITVQLSLFVFAAAALWYARDIFKSYSLSNSRAHAV